MTSRIVVKIATVISADVRRLAYVRPGDRVRFEETTVDEPRRIERESEVRFREAIDEH